MTLSMPSLQASRRKIDDGGQFLQRQPGSRHQLGNYRLRKATPDCGTQISFRLWRSSGKHSSRELIRGQNRPASTWMAPAFSLFAAFDLNIIASLDDHHDWFSTRHV